ncbi:MAG: hypothetical protein R3F49_03595 [Planctomycetota bacterium]
MTHGLRLLRGIGNAPTAAVEALLRRAKERVLTFHADPVAAVLELRP